MIIPDLVPVQDYFFYSCLQNNPVHSRTQLKERNILYAQSRKFHSDFPFATSSIIRQAQFLPRILFSLRRNIYVTTYNER